LQACGVQIGNRALRVAKPQPFQIARHPRSPQCFRAETAESMEAKSYSCGVKCPMQIALGHWAIAWAICETFFPARYRRLIRAALNFTLYISPPASMTRRWRESRGCGYGTKV
jgi:hypothetical protein